jgi:hypothetical protein
LTRTHWVRLTVRYHYHNYHHYHHLVLSLAVTVLLNTFTHSPDANSITNALLLLFIIDSLLTSSLSLTPQFQSILNLLLTFSLLLTPYWHSDHQQHLIHIYSIIDSLLTFSLLTPSWHLVYHSLLTDI